jgi:hypothetical protein
MSAARADSSASTVSSRVSTDHAVPAIYQIWYRSVWPGIHTNAERIHFAIKHGVVEL